jgi:hypothetical protein
MCATRRKGRNSEKVPLGGVRWTLFLDPSVNTKNWYRKEIDPWADFGRRVPFGERFSSKHSVKTSSVGSMSSFGRRDVSCLEEEAFGNA